MNGNNIRRLGNWPGTRVVIAGLQEERPHAGGGLDELVQAAAGTDGVCPGATPMTNAALMPTPAKTLSELMAGVHAQSWWEKACKAFLP